MDWLEGSTVHASTTASRLGESRSGRWAVALFYGLALVSILAVPACSDRSYRPEADNGVDRDGSDPTDRGNECGSGLVSYEGCTACRSPCTCESVNGGSLRSCVPPCTSSYACAEGSVCATHPRAQAPFCVPERVHTLESSPLEKGGAAMNVDCFLGPEPVYKCTGDFLTRVRVIIIGGWISGSICVAEVVRFCVSGCVGADGTAECRNDGP
jgi:hypothetical protein